MAASISSAVKMSSVINDLNKRLKSYIPDRNSFEPPDKALYGADSMFNTKAEEAEKYRLDAIKYAFKLHYEKNKFYHDFCVEHNVKPDDIKSTDDFAKIPLVSHKFFKDYPSGKDFAVWLANIMTGDIPKIKIEKNNPSFDDVIKSFGNVGITVAYSSGTTGKFTFIPRDERTFKSAEYSIARSVIEMLHQWWRYDSYAYLLFPHSFKTNLYVGKVTSVLFDAIKDVRAAIDREITTDLIRISMGRPKGLKERAMAGMLKLASKRMNEKMVNDIIEWMEKLEKTDERIFFAGAPFILNMVMDKMDREGLKFDFGDRGAVMTGGGWKTQENHRMPVEEFREKVKKFIGIPENQCLDLYAMVEGNGFMTQCPEGHYLHIPHNYYHPMVLDENNEPVGYGEYGKFAFLDSLARSYPGFIFTGDRVRMLEHCPVCDRPGPVLEPEVKRMAGEEIRGCAEEMRKMLLSDLKEVSK
ncbi:MAG TPA: hypothetical protein ENF91_03165 [Thermoplasmatales archaeon]|nr:MAG: hypothetical protein DRN17_00195 [Thermoplasmata archaeon]HDH82073.1 hypothetical protein [Thermoplasmatales archaeon]